jgi:hypothetical protein
MERRTDLGMQGRVMSLAMLASVVPRRLVDMAAAYLSFGNRWADDVPEWPPPGGQFAVAGSA